MEGNGRFDCNDILIPLFKALSSFLLIAKVDGAGQFLTFKMDLKLVLALGLVPVTVETEAWVVALTSPVKSSSMTSS